MATVLIADDSHLARRQAKAAIRQAGYDVIEAKNGKEAVEMIIQSPPDFVLLDQLMPEMEGMEVVDWMLENNIKIPFAILSADIQFSTRDMFLGKGAAGVLNKPPQVFQLQELISRYVEPAK